MSRKQSPLRLRVVSHTMTPAARAVKAATSGPTSAFNAATAAKVKASREAAAERLTKPPVHTKRATATRTTSSSPVKSAPSRSPSVSQSPPQQRKTQKPAAGTAKQKPLDTTDEPLDAAAWLENVRKTAAAVRKHEQSINEEEEKENVAPASNLKKTNTSSPRKNLRVSYSQEIHYSDPPAQHDDDSYESSREEHVDDSADHVSDGFRLPITESMRRDSDAGDFPTSRSRAAQNKPPVFKARYGYSKADIEEAERKLKEQEEGEEEDGEAGASHEDIEEDISEELDVDSLHEPAYSEEPVVSGKRKPMQGPPPVSRSSRTGLPLSPIAASPRVGNSTDSTPRVNLSHGSRGSNNSNRSTPAGISPGVSQQFNPHNQSLTSSSTLIIPPSLSHSTNLNASMNLNTSSSGEPSVRSSAADLIRRFREAPPRSREERDADEQRKAAEAARAAGLADVPPPKRQIPWWMEEALASPFVSTASERDEAETRKSFALSTIAGSPATSVAASVANSTLSASKPNISASTSFDAANNSILRSSLTEPFDPSKNSILQESSPSFHSSAKPKTSFNPKSNSILDDSHSHDEMNVSHSHAEFGSTINPRLGEEKMLKTSDFSDFDSSKSKSAQSSAKPSVSLAEAARRNHHQSNPSLSAGLYDDEFDPASPSHAVNHSSESPISTAIPASAHNPFSDSEDSFALHNNKPHKKQTLDDFDDDDDMARPMDDDDALDAEELRLSRPKVNRLESTLLPGGVHPALNLTSPDAVAVVSPQTALSDSDPFNHHHSPVPSTVAAKPTSNDLMLPKIPPLISAHDSSPRLTDREMNQKAASTEEPRFVPPPDEHLTAAAHMSKHSRHNSSASNAQSALNKSVPSFERILSPDTQEVHDVSKFVRKSENSSTSSSATNLKSAAASAASSGANLSHSLGSGPSGASSSFSHLPVSKSLDKLDEKDAVLRASTSFHSDQYDEHIPLDSHRLEEESIEEDLMRSHDSTHVPDSLLVPNSGSKHPNESSESLSPSGLDAPQSVLSSMHMLKPLRVRSGQHGSASNLPSSPMGSPSESTIPPEFANNDVLSCDLCHQTSACMVWCGECKMKLCARDLNSVSARRKAAASLLMSASSYEDFQALQQLQQKSCQDDLHGEGKFFANHKVVMIRKPTAEPEDAVAEEATQSDPKATKKHEATSAVAPRSRTVSAALAPIDGFKRVDANLKTLASVFGTTPVSASNASVSGTTMGTRGSSALGFVRDKDAAAASSAPDSHRSVGSIDDEPALTPRKSPREYGSGSNPNSGASTARESPSSLLRREKERAARLISMTPSPPISPVLSSVQPTEELSADEFASVSPAVASIPSPLDSQRSTRTDAPRMEEILEGSMEEMLVSSVDEPDQIRSRRKPSPQKKVASPEAATPSPAAPQLISPSTSDMPSSEPLTHSRSSSQITPYSLMSGVPSSLPVVGSNSHSRSNSYVASSSALPSGPPQHQPHHPSFSKSPGAPSQAVAPSTYLHMHPNDISPLDLPRLKKSASNASNIKSPELSERKSVRVDDEEEDSTSGINDSYIDRLLLKQRQASTQAIATPASVSKSSLPQCVLCSRAPAAFYCSACNLYLCGPHQGGNNCDRDVHSTSDRLRAHKRTNLLDPAAQKEMEQEQEAQLEFESWKKQQVSPDATVPAGSSVSPTVVAHALQHLPPVSRPSYPHSLPPLPIAGLKAGNLNHLSPQPPAAVYETAPTQPIHTGAAFVSVPLPADFLSGTSSSSSVKPHHTPSPPVVGVLHPSPSPQSFFSPSPSATAAVAAIGNESARIEDSVTSLPSMEELDAALQQNAKNLQSMGVQIPLHESKISTPPVHEEKSVNSVKSPVRDTHATAKPVAAMVLVSTPHDAIISSRRDKDTLDESSMESWDTSVSSYFTDDAESPEKPITAAKPIVSPAPAVISTVAPASMPVSGSKEHTSVRAAARNIQFRLDSAMQRFQTQVHDGKKPVEEEKKVEIDERDERLKRVEGLLEKLVTAQANPVMPSAAVVAQPIKGAYPASLAHLPPAAQQAVKAALRAAALSQQAVSVATARPIAVHPTQKSNVNPVTSMGQSLNLSGSRRGSFQQQQPHSQSHHQQSSHRPVVPPLPLPLPPAPSNRAAAEPVKSTSNRPVSTAQVIPVSAHTQQHPRADSHRPPSSHHRVPEVRVDPPQPDSHRSQPPSRDLSSRRSSAPSLVGLPPPTDRHTLAANAAALSSNRGGRPPSSRRNSNAPPAANSARPSHEASKSTAADATQSQLFQLLAMQQKTIDEQAALIASVSAANQQRAEEERAEREAREKATKEREETAWREKVLQAVQQQQQQQNASFYHHPTATAPYYPQTHQQPRVFPSAISGHSSMFQQSTPGPQQPQPQPAHRPFHGMFASQFRPVAAAAAVIAPTPAVPVMQIQSPVAVQMKSPVAHPTLSVESPTAQIATPTPALQPLIPAAGTLIPESIPTPSAAAAGPVQSVIPNASPVAALAPAFSLLSQTLDESAKRREQLLKLLQS